MLRLFRKHASSWIIKFLLGIVVVVFIFWGVGSFRSQRETQIAVVNGESISNEKFIKTYNNLIDQYRERFGNSLSEEMIKMLQLKKKALDMIIDQKVLLNEADRLGIKVSNQELANEIAKIGAFQDNGNFDVERYRMILNRNKLTPEEFESDQREMMRMEKLRLLVQESVKVSEAEAKEWFDWNNSLVNIDIVEFNPGSYMDIKASDEEVLAFFEKNKNSYKTDPKVRVRFLKFDPNTYESKVKITDDEINEYYTGNKDMYFSPKTVEARHILLKVDENASAETVEAKKNAVLNILNLVKGGEDFSELAKKYSEDQTKEKGGYLGAFKKETMVKPFSDKAFSMKAGEISDPVRTQFGWHLIKVEKVNEEYTKPIEEVKGDISKKLSHEKAKSMAYDEAEPVYDGCTGGDDLVKSAKEKGLELKETDLFTQKNPYKGVKNNVQFAATAFSLPVMGISEVKDFDDGYYILQVTEKLPEAIPALKEVQGEVTADLIKERQESRASEEAGKLLAAIKGGETITEASGKLNAKVITTGFFKRKEAIPVIGADQKISDAAFQLSDGKKVVETVIKGSKGFYVLQLKERKKPHVEEFGKEKETVMAKLLEQKKYKTFNEWLAQLKKQNEISIENGFLE